MAVGITNVIVVIFILELITQINGQIWRPPSGPDQAAVCYDENGNEYLHGQTIFQDCNTCTCLDSSWSCTEIACSDPCFSSPCQNDGLCVKKFDHYYDCICSRGYSGHDCQIELPSDACYDGKDTLLNGETFKHDDCEQECKCDNGEVTCDFNGCPEPECENPIYSPHYCCPICWPEEEPGFCPGTSLSTAIGTCEETCRHDVDCEDSQKCCFNGCGMSCTDAQPEPTALCAESPCQNGATCIDILSFVVICQCLPGFHGEYCEKEDGKACYHDGVWYRDGQTESELEYCYECICDDGFFECFDRCAERPGECPDGHYYDFNSYGCYYDNDCPLGEKCCSGECLTPDPSGLSCIYNGIHLNNGESYHETCHFCICQRGEVHCDDSRCVQDKPGTCPPADDVGICIVECDRDMECPGIEKCCVNGCGGGVCTQPLEASVTSSCYFEDDWHDEGEIVRNEHDCGVCFCSNGTVLCRTPICPEVPCYQPTYVESECCPICIDYGTHPGECPAITYTSPPLTCNSTCEYDYYCESDEKCCQTECGGKGCVKAISLDHPGMCPYLVYDTYFYYYPYQDKCQIDDHCPSNEKCCYDISEQKTCMESIPEDTVICSDYPCLNGGTCEQYWEPWTYICTCADGFTGSNCEEIDDGCHVSPNPCMNGGSCTGFEGYPCDCPMEYTGEFCEDMCDNSMCQNGGNCTGYAYQPCYCPFGYTGDYCETPLCNSNPCMNGGTCTGYDWYPCYCPYGYGGEHCDEENACASDPCMNGGICLRNFDYTYFSEYTPSTYEELLCLCLPGYGGTFCEQNLCDPDPCNNGGTCSGIDSYPCYCPYGFTGDYCEEESLCASQPCMNGGVCIADYDYSYSWSFSFSSYFDVSDTCSCPFGYGGEYCEIVTCNSTVCYNGGYCTGYDFWPCICAPGFYGNFCEEEFEFSEYSWSWFWSESSSSDVTGLPSYPPSPDYSDHDYADIPSTPSPDGSGDDDTESDDEEDGHKIPDHCNPNPCLNHGRCHVIGFYYPYVPYYCECAPGFVGEKCEEDIRCANNYCLNRGICINSVYGSYCECPKDVSGDYCEVVSPCAGRPCHNGGTCNHFYGDIFTCSCPPGTSGETCDVLHDDVCENSPCVNFGSCTEFGGVADCSCVEGYTGKFCEIIIEDETCPDGTHPDSCLFDPCQVANCPENPHARCQSNYCGCIAEFFDENGNIVECHNCPENNEVTCVINPCEFVTCEADTRARCEVNYCGECEAVFYDLQGNLLNCESGAITCQYNELTYYTNEQRDHEDACNTCTCTKLGEWDCTVKKCPGRVVVQMEFTLEYNYDDIIEDIENFKNNIISQLAKQYGIGENNFKDVQVRRGSVIVEFKLVNEEDIDSQEVADMMFEELSSGNVDFEYNGDTLAVRPESVKQPKVIENEPTDEDNHLVFIVVCVVVVTIVFVGGVIIGYIVTSRRAKKAEQAQTNLQAINTVSQSNPYAQLDKEKLSGTVVYDNLGGATIKGSDNPTYIP